MLVQVCAMYNTVTIQEKVVQKSPLKERDRLSAKHDIVNEGEDIAGRSNKKSRNISRSGSKEFRKQLCDEIASHVNGSITPSDVGQLPYYTPKMPATDIEKLYKIHEEPFVFLDVTSLEVFQYFRYVVQESIDYKILLHGLEARNVMICTLFTGIGLFR